jgi:hypothetical protein
MDDFNFLEQLGGDYGTEYATLKAVVADGQVCHISDRVNPYRLLDVCPLLYHAFEYGSQSRLQASIEAPSRASVISLLRYCYTGSYLPPGAEYAPITLLLHAEVYKMAEDYDRSTVRVAYLPHRKICTTPFVLSTTTSRAHKHASNMTWYIHCSTTAYPCFSTTRWERA